MATYSAFFSSGLLAPHAARCTTPALPPSPMGLSASSVDLVDRQLSLTPTPVGQTSPSPKSREVRTNAERPPMRRRRSSISVGTSPMALIKSPVRNAGAALQRTGFVSPTRHRAGSVGVNEALESNSLFGRLRSGSVGGAANPPRRLRRAICRPVPRAPPPSAPLPAVPCPPTPKCGSSLLPPVILSPVPQQSLAARSSSVDDVGNLFSPTFSSTLLSPDYTGKISLKSSPDISGTRGDIIDHVMVEN